MNLEAIKTVKVIVKEDTSRYAVSQPIYKEDYGLYFLIIEGLELPEVYTVDFSNSETTGKSVSMLGNSDGVLIPKQFIDTGKDIFAFLYITGDGFGRTVYKFKIPNRIRPDRTEEQPTPEEQSVIDQAISALNTAVEQTAQDKADADASAQSASADAERAEEARTDAQNYATQAEQSATDAQESASQASASATASAQSASQSAQIKADVEDLADDAQGYAQASAQSATASANSASQAQSYSQTASSKATDASTSAQTATQKATESAQSASQALGYKTDAESAKTASQTAQGLAESARDSAVQAKMDVQNIADGIDTRLTDVEADVIKAFPTDTASGAVASFSDGADDLPLKSLIVDINPVQDGTGDPSPSNDRPISGWTGMQLNANGTVIPISWQTEAGTVYGGTLDAVSGELVVTHTVTNLNGSENGWFKSAVTTVDAYCLPLRSNSLDGDTVLSHFKYVNQRNYNVEGCAWYDSDGKQLRIGYATSGTDLTAFKTWLSSNNVQLFSKLDNPLTYQLSATEIKSLYGQNNIFADTGDTSAEYRADPDLYIQRKMPDVPVDDVQINGSSIVNDGVANIPYATASSVGVVRTSTDRGTQMLSGNILGLKTAESSNIKTGTNAYRPIVPNTQHESTFYGLAKSAGDTTQSQSSNAVGVYTEDAKSKISEMLGGSVSVSGTTPTIVAKSGIRYVCGEVATLDFTPSASGICDVVFTSGATATVLTVPSTVKWANGFDPTSLEANTTYEINIMDGLGVAVGWT